MKSSPSRSRWPVAVALLCSSVLSLLAVEVALRVRRGGVFSAKPPGADARMVGGYPAAWDAELGYVPKPGTRGRNNPWRTRVTIDAQGIRIEFGANTHRLDGRAGPSEHRFDLGDVKLCANRGAERRCDPVGDRFVRKTAHHEEQHQKNAGDRNREGPKPARQLAAGTVNRSGHVTAARSWKL